MLQAKADDKGDLTDTTSTKKEDEKYLAELTATCKTKAADFESRQQLRTEEITAIEKAIEIISSGAVAGNANKHLAKMLQSEETFSYAQLRSDKKSPIQRHVALYLQAKAKSL